jgi:putative Mn2+ efflux pump MntP
MKKKEQMKIFKDRDGNKLTFSEFIERWKKGISEVTPKQKLESSLFFQAIMTAGFFFGFCFAIYHYSTMWWLAIILFGGLGVNVIQYLGLRQSLNVFKKIEEEFEKQEILKVLGEENEKDNIL